MMAGTPSNIGDGSVGFRVDERFYNGLSTENPERGAFRKSSSYSVIR